MSSAPEASQAADGAEQTARMRRELGMSKLIELRRVVPTSKVAPGCEPYEMIDVGSFPPAYVVVVRGLRDRSKLKEIAESLGAVVVLRGSPIVALEADEAIELWEVVK